MFEKLFHLKENNTNVKTECIAGVTTFMTMAYILAVNPSILSSTGMNPTAVLLATCLASFLGTMCMGMMANLPFALSAGMGLNAFFAYTVCGNMGYPWQVALLAVFVEGLIDPATGLTPRRENAAGDSRRQLVFRRNSREHTSVRAGISPVSGGGELSVLSVNLHPDDGAVYGAAPDAHSGISGGDDGTGLSVYFRAAGGGISDTKCTGVPSGICYAENRILFHRAADL